MSSSPPPPPPASSSTKLFIPQPKDEDPSCRIVGILERKRPEENTQGKPIALIIHGSMGHKDYIYQRKLAALLPIDSFRFDFRGNLESGGKWSLAALPNEIDDIQCVAHHLHTVYGYLIRVVIGHSKGSVTSCKWIAGATKPLPGEGGEEEEGGGGGEGGSEEARQVRAFVNVAGRHRMYKFRYLYDLHEEAIKAQGYGIWKVKVAGKPVDARVYPHDIEAFSKWDTTYVSREFPSNVDVLTIHGLEDGIVPPYDAVLHAQAFDDRVGGEGKHTLHFIEEADHNFKGHQEEVNATIVEWLERLQEYDERKGKGKGKGEGEEGEKKGSSERKGEGEGEGGLRVKFTGIWRSRVHRPRSPSASISKL